MAPKEIIFTKDQIVQAAFDIVKELGRDALSARKVAERLGSSTAPVYSYFASMQELEEAVEKVVHELLLEYTQRPYTPRPDLNMGVGVVLFARDHPRFFTAVHTKGTKACDIDTDLENFMLKQLKKMSAYAQLPEDDMQSLFSKLKIFSHGLGLLACTNQLPYYNDDYIIYMFWELGEELIDATLTKMQHAADYIVIHGLKVHKDKIEQLSQWREKLSQDRPASPKGE